MEPTNEKKLLTKDIKIFMLKLLQQKEVTTEDIENLFRHFENLDLIQRVQIVFKDFNENED